MGGGSYSLKMEISSALYASAIPCDGFWYAFTEAGQIVGKDKSLEVALNQAEAAGFPDAILTFGHPPGKEAV